MCFNVIWTDEKGKEKHTMQGTKHSKHAVKSCTVVFTRIHQRIDGGMPTKSGLFPVKFHSLPLTLDKRSHLFEVLLWS